MSNHPAVPIGPLTAGQAIGVVERCLNAVGATRDDIIPEARDPAASRLRMATMWTAHQALKGTPRGSLSALGRVFRRDHTTVLYNIRKAEALRAIDESFKAMTERMALASTGHLRSALGDTTGEVAE